MRKLAVYKVKHLELNKGESLSKQFGGKAIKRETERGCSVCFKGTHLHLPPHYSADVHSPDLADLQSGGKVGVN